MGSDARSLWDADFGADEIDALNAAFDESAVWESTLQAADAFWTASGRTRNPLDEDPLWAWHLLVLSVGNFKRQAPITLPRLGDRGSRHMDSRPEQVEVPVREDKTILLKVDDPETWIALCKEVRGVSVATASTLLSALWPGEHVIIDIRDINAARGLDYADAATNKLVKAGGRQGDPVSWTAYQWLRPRVLAKADDTGRQPVDVERALFILADRAGRAQVRDFMERYGLTKKRDVPRDLPWVGEHGYEFFLRAEMAAARSEYRASQSSSSSASDQV